MIEDEIEITDKFEASCNGKDKVGHPLVYFHLDDDEIISCPYCGKKFRQQL